MKNPVIARRVTATFSTDFSEIHVDESDSPTVSVVTDASILVGSIRRKDRRLSRRTGVTVVTTIEWCNVPPGFVPPK